MGLRDCSPSLEATHEQVSTLTSISGSSFENPPSVDVDPAAYTALHSSRLKSLPPPSPEQPNAEKLKNSEFELSPTVFAEAMVYPTPQDDLVTTAPPSSSLITCL
ncbi:hypothetical protein VP01_3391g1 [Puccinia sorghi]|uniref:Uncharacterized protein n=1 Tax=Puccinia sorghi TaxID=27349 RepID=A0A0L6UWM6_9BASI|nr:hypothetical protein VP01_3391g1 [Puccinia sorghi]